MNLMTKVLFPRLLCILSFFNLFPEVVETSEPRTPRNNTPQTKSARLPEQLQSKSGDTFHVGVKAAGSATTSAQNISNSLAGGPRNPHASSSTSTDLNASSSDSESESDSDDPTAKYVRLQSRLAKFTTHRRPGIQTTNNKVQALKRQIEEVTKDYLFDKKAAEERWKAVQRQVEMSIQQDRLRGNIQEIVKPPKPSVKDRPRPEVAEPKTDARDVFSDNDSDAGGIFDILDEIPPSITDDRGVTIQVRDMALPKHWSGQLPKKLLAELVNKVDRFAAVTYSNLSGSSRATRFAVSIRWNGRKSDDWSMDDIACHDSFQAEQYISLVALHSLSYPTSAGFAGGSSTVTSAPTFFRLLPPTYRDLWDELEEKRKTSNDNINRSAWAKLQKILEPKLEVSERVSSNCVARRTPTHFAHFSTDW
jgi:ATP-dependent RNA helicase DHX29